MNDPFTAEQRLPVDGLNHGCQGQCRRYRTCEGRVSRVSVHDKDGFDWGEFWYCGMAITEDRQRGLEVNVVTTHG